MLLMGDEYSRSQGGNNNSWCQDNPIGWMHWDSSPADENLIDFIKKLLIIRKSIPELFSPEFCFEERKLKDQKNKYCYSIKWHGIKLNSPDWSDWSHTISYSLHKNQNTAVMWLGLNAYSKAMQFDLPNPSSSWIELINTNNPRKLDKTKVALPTSQKHIALESRSVIMTLDKEYACRLRL
tara:strand:+ start:70 stop:612 length:543 start_codon:yes stop_codon:yes gene_type:complete